MPPVVLDIDAVVSRLVFLLCTPGGCGGVDVYRHLHRISHITVAVFDIEGSGNLALSGDLVGGNRIGAVYRVLQLIIKCQRFSRRCLGFCGIKNRSIGRAFCHICIGKALYLNRLLIPEIFGAGGLRRSKGICNGKLR